ncbi:Putative amino-acid acetyltransferase (fragment) [Desulfamplus magnetovallimortis]|uniref:Putative amino-acid acetyltransferase n=1 Tax=Desulfamplus magnetovallimortis TaxID=1246637 RepID=A0A1W1H9N9_9BACT
MSKNNAIAIIGMGAIFPHSSGLQQYWNLIFNGVDAITDIPETTHWSLKDYFDENPATPDHTYCKRGGFIPETNFDPARYGMPPKNIEATDTSQLLGLMVAEMAMEDAGYPVRSSSFDKKRTNIILGVTGTQELVIPLGARLYHPLWKKALSDANIPTEKMDEVLQRISGLFPDWQENSFPGLLGNVVAGRIANRLDLGGTNSVVDAACASSLSAIHTSCMELASGRCDLSISGGVDTLNDIFMHMCFSKTGVLSHSGDAKPFSKDADGTVLGEGIGMVVLKRLEDSQRDNDRIYAVIKGIGTSSDGKTGGIYAPDSAGQLRALKAAYTEAEIDPETVELFEAHGTGTRVGDKIEFSSLKSLMSGKNPQKPAAVGSVKSMIGHAKAAAGIAGLIKTALSLYHKVLPPTLKAENPDPELGMEKSPFYLNHLSKPWLNSSKYPRRAGVSAFGFGGSNFHAVLEEYKDEKEHVSWDGTLQIAAFSHDTIEGLCNIIEKFRQDMQTSLHFDFGEKNQMLAWRSEKSRKNFNASDNFRLLMAIKNSEDPVKKCDIAISTLNDSIQYRNSTTKQFSFQGSDSKIKQHAFEGKNNRLKNRPDENPINQTEQKKLEKSGIFFGSGLKTGKIAFLFPGQGSQYTGMGRELLSIFPEALQTLELAEKTLKTHNILPGNLLASSLFPLPPYANEIKQAEETLRATDIAQPAIGAVSLAMSKILKRFGIEPDITCGHSFGELTALCAAGWIDEESFFKLAGNRGKYMAKAADSEDEKGGMLAVKAPLSKIEHYLKEEKLDLVLANRNTHQQGVLSGDIEEIRRAAAILKKHKIRSIELPVAAAFHSKLIENAIKPFAESVRTIAIKHNNTTVMSNTTGTPYPDKPEEAYELLGKQLGNPVDFVADIEYMHATGVTTFIEVGPKNILSGLTRSILEKKEIKCLTLDASSGKNRAIEDLSILLCTLGASGINVTLDQWEDAVKEPEKKLIRVPLTGANPKKQKMPDQNHDVKITVNRKKTLSGKIHPHSSSAQKSSPQNESISGAKPSRPILALNPEHRGANMQSNRFNEQEATSCEQDSDISKQNNQSDFSQHLIFSAMQLVQKGMESMQDLQARTAHAHEKFLETQSNSGKTLQAMMEQTRFFAQNAIDSCYIGYTGNKENNVRKKEGNNGKSGQLNRLSLATQSSPKLSHDLSAKSLKNEHTNYFNPYQNSTISHCDDKPAEPDDNKIDHNYRHNELNSSSPEKSSVTSQHNIVTSQYNNKSQNSDLSSKAENILLETVCNLTGFPVEMLSLDMDIESDLGIDSIKRVEIVSELEKKLPDTATLTPEHMGSLKTLRDIVDLLSSGKEKQTSHEYQYSSEKKNESSPVQTNNGDVMALLMETISNLTGFPVEMLTSDMDLESDLGIDSIKRVEILSSLEQKIPEAGIISPDDLGSLKTLEQIAKKISGEYEDNQYCQEIGDTCYENNKTCQEVGDTSHENNNTCQEVGDTCQGINNTCQGVSDTCHGNAKSRIYETTTTSIETKKTSETVHLTKKDTF